MPPLGGEGEYNFLVLPTGGENEDGSQEMNHGGPRESGVPSLTFEPGGEKLNSYDSLSRLSRVALRSTSASASRTLLEFCAVLGREIFSVIRLVTEADCVSIIAGRSRLPMAVKYPKTEVTLFSKHVT
jgi:hypothetical protein